MPLKKMDKPPFFKNPDIGYKESGGFCDGTFKLTPEEIAAHMFFYIPEEAKFKMALEKHLKEAIEMIQVSEQERIRLSNKEYRKIQKEKCNQAVSYLLDFLNKEKKIEE